MSSPRADMSRAWKERPISTFFATGGGIGMIPFAPGTWGSVEGLGITIAVFSWLDGWHGYVHATFSPVLEFGLILCVALVVFFFGVLMSGRSEESTNAHDPGQIVIDEVAGQVIASSPLPFLGVISHIPAGIWLVSFVLFRLFDIWKPGPIRKLQDLPGGWGIMLDDVAAGLLAGVFTYGIGRVL